MSKIVVSPMLLMGALWSLPVYAQVTVTDAWVRGTVPGQRATGAFMKLMAAEDSTLVAAASPIATTVEIHEMKTEEGVMKMRAIDRLALPKDQGVTLAPGGYHVMLMGLAKPVAAGENVPITLTFERKDGSRSTVAVSASVRPLGVGQTVKH
ncbi:MAG TPA: copper chaperone PCu(A)C [Casimicrobiaceae bacterium]|nr:copper chaperone PCu(A)C [Casimicrobiaceae bacterium]